MDGQTEKIFLNAVTTLDSALKRIATALERANELTALTLNPEQKAILEQMDLAKRSGIRGKSPQS